MKDYWVIYLSFADSYGEYNVSFHGDLAFRF